MSTWIQRAIGAARLDPAVYEEVEADESALGQAMGVVVIASIAAGIGASFRGPQGPSLLAGVLFNLVGWFAWAFVVYVVGTRLLPTAETKADVGQLLRTTGFAASPGVLAILSVVPLVGGLIGFAVGVWELAAMVVAVRQALDYQSTGRALAVCAIGFAVYVLIAIVLAGALFGLGHAPSPPAAP
jgi:hypothetical protein